MNAAPGQIIGLRLPWGGALELPVPEGKAAGDEIKIMVPTPAQFLGAGNQPGEMQKRMVSSSFTVPEDKAPGDTISLQTLFDSLENLPLGHGEQNVLFRL